MTDSDIIFCYSRKNAINDGYQVEATVKTREEVGIRYPVYLTSTVYNRYVKVPDELKGFQDEDARLFELLYMFALSARQANERDYWVNFSLSVMIPKGVEWLKNEKKDFARTHRVVTLQSNIGPADFDDPSPAITIMIPGED